MRSALTARSRRTSAPARRAAAPGSASAARRSTRPMPRASSRALSPAPSRPATLDVPADLGERIETALRQQALDRLGPRSSRRDAGQRRRAGRSRRAAGQGPPADPRRRRRRGRQQAARPGLAGRRRQTRQGLVFPEGRTILSMALGRENVVHIALTDAAAARRVTHAIDRWQAFIDPDAGLDGGHCRWAERG